MRDKFLKIMQKSTIAKIAGVAALTLALAMPLATFAKIGNGVVSGKVTSVSGTTIDLNAKSGSYVIDASAAKMVKRFGGKMSVSDIQTGDVLRVQGQISGTNVTAKNIIDLSLQVRNGVFLGTVKSISGNDFVLQSRGRGQQTVNTNGDTKFYKNGKIASSSDLVVGEEVRVTGIWDRTNKNITATKVDIIIRMVTVRINGTFQSASGATLTVLGNNKVTYTVDASKARIIYKGGHKGNVGVLQANDKVQIYGKRQDITGTTDIVASLIRDLSQIHKKSSPAINTNTSTSTGATAR